MGRRLPWSYWVSRRGRTGVGLGHAPGKLASRFMLHCDSVVPIVVDPYFGLEHGWIMPMNMLTLAHCAQATRVRQ